MAEKTPSASNRHKCSSIRKPPGPAGSLQPAGPRQPAGLQQPASPQQPAGPQRPAGGLQVCCSWQVRGSPQVCSGQQVGSSPQVRSGNISCGTRATTQRLKCVELLFASKRVPAFNALAATPLIDMPAMLWELAVSGACAGAATPPSLAAGPRSRKCCLQPFALRGFYILRLGPRGTTLPRASQRLSAGCRLHRRLCSRRCISLAPIRWQVFCQTTTCP